MPLLLLLGAAAAPVDAAVSQTIPDFANTSDADIVFVGAISVSVSQTIPAFTNNAVVRLGPTTPGLIFGGQIGQVSINKRGLATFEARGPMTLARGIITEHYCQACRADLYDNRCNILASSYATTVVVATIIDAQTFTVVSASNPTGWFDQGQGNTASNDPFAIKSWTLSTLTVTTMNAIDLIISPGDTLTLYAGCDKSSTTCISKFNNIDNYRGEEFAPGRDLALTSAG